MTSREISGWLLMLRLVKNTRIMPGLRYKLNLRPPLRRETEMPRWPGSRELPPVSEHTKELVRANQARGAMAHSHADTRTRIPVA